MSTLNLIFDFEKDNDVYNRDAYHYLINMMKMRKELNRLRKEELAHKKMVELFEKHENDYYDNHCKKIWKLIASNCWATIKLLFLKMPFFNFVKENKFNLLKID